MIEETIEFEEKEIKKKKRKERGKMTGILIAIVAIVLLSFIYIRYIATAGFIVKEYNVTSEKLPDNFNGFKIAHLSDIHFGLQ